MPIASGYHGRVPRALRLAVVLLLGVAAAPIAAVAPVRQPALDDALFRTMSWRLLGPFSGGRATAVAGAASHPHVFFAGTARGGVWKTTDAGGTWRPVFDDQATGAIGAAAVFPSNADVVIVGTGEVTLAGDAASGAGLFRSTDGGDTWASIGLASEPHITAVEFDPRQPDRIFAASAPARRQGPTATPSSPGIYRTTDGGKTFSRVFAADAGTGPIDLIVVPSNPSVLFAALVDWRDASARSGQTQTLIVRSSDGGDTWTSADRGLPPDGEWARIAATPDGRRVFAFVQAPAGGGLYRSDDGANTWTLALPANTEPLASAEVAVIASDPSNADVVYLAGRSILRSEDGGRTFSVWRRHDPRGLVRALWLNPSAPAIAAAASDYGITVTVNGGQSWNAPAGQPIGHFVKVVTDAAFPYRVCAVAIARPTGCLPVRGDRGRIGAADWQDVSPVPGMMVAPDPQNGDLLYTGALGRFDRRSGQTQYVGPAPVPLARDAAGGAIVFAADGKTAYFGTDVLYRGAAGQSWTVISPEISRGGAIRTIGPSPIDARVVWVGTDDGVIQVTRDAGASWSSVSPPALSVGWRVAAVEPSHFDTSTSYAAALAADGSAGAWRTRDAGATWQSITSGLPGGTVVHAIREDALRRGLLFAATSRSVFVSFDDGDRWQPLRLNLPPVPVMDLVIKESDLVIATGGRGLWVMDDLSPFRQITPDVARANLFLFRPAVAWRTPPAPAMDSAAPDEAAAANPPDGATVTYIAHSGAGPVRLEIIETLSGDVIHRFDDLPVGDGLQRVSWDLRYAPIGGRSVWVMPGTYQVRLTAGAQVARQAVIVRMDPRVRASPADLMAQFKTSRAVYERRRAVAGALATIDPASAQARAAELSGSADDLDRALDVLQQADARPTPAAEALAAAAMARADEVLARVQ